MTAVCTALLKIVLGGLTRWSLERDVYRERHGTYETLGAVDGGDGA